MTSYEIIVDVRVRKTLVLSGPTSKDTARKIIESALKPDGLGTWIFQKKENDSASFPMPRPVETIIDNNPQIMEVRLIE